MTCVDATGLPVDIEKWLLEFEDVEEKDDCKWSTYFIPSYAQE